MSEPAILGIEQGTYVEVHGLHMYYKSHGEGIPVVLLHGGLETCRMWDQLVAVLSRTYRVITPDSRGHGRTDNPAEKISYPLMAEDFTQFIQVLGLDSPFVAGYSDRGQTALCMAINHPTLARGTMTGATELRMTDEWRQMMKYGLGIDGAGNVDFERIAQTNPDLIKTLQEKHDSFHAPGYWKTLLNAVSNYWLSPPQYPQTELAKITAPVLVWSGDRDELCPPEQSLELYRMVQGAELALIPNADHFSMFAQQELAIEILLNFMQRVTESA